MNDIHIDKVWVVPVYSHNKWNFKVVSPKLAHLLLEDGGLPIMRTPYQRERERQISERWRRLLDKKY